MKTRILRTKLYIPPPKPALIPRLHLIEQLNDGLARKLIVVSAPAGFGKTTLIAEWGGVLVASQASRSASHEPKLAWLSLDQRDNDLGRFLAYFVAALQTIKPVLGIDALRMVETVPLQATSVESVLVSLVNEIAAETAVFALVLDDYHLIDNPEVHDAIAFLIEHLPPPPTGMTLIIASRTDPPLPLPRWRVRGELVELRSADLAFSVAETAVFLHNATGLPLSEIEVSSLTNRTEGWIAGLQMAALSMQKRAPETVPEFIRSFTGSHHYILDYLTEEVLRQQPEQIRTFLLRTSILERLNASLCNAVTGENNGRTILAQLEQANLFLIPLDDERRWYRYHHLFADLLRSRLTQTQSAQIPILHRRASEWYESQEQIVEAVGYALEAGDVDRIEYLVAGNILSIMYHGDLAIMTRWLEALPNEIMRSRPRLCVAYAWVLAFAGQFDDIEPVLQNVEHVLASPSESDHTAWEPSFLRHTEGQIKAVRAYVTAFTGSMSCASKLARQALEDLPKTDLAMRGCAALILGCALRHQGDFSEAEKIFAEAVAISRMAGNIHFKVDVLWEQAVLQLAQGQLRKAMATCEEALQIADWHTKESGQQLQVTGYIYTLMSYVLREWNELETALHYAQEGIERCQRWGQADALVQGYFYLADVLYAVGRMDEALNALQKVRHVANSLGRWYSVTFGEREARIRLAKGDMTAATRWVEESGLDTYAEPSIGYRNSYLALAEILMVQGRLGDAWNLLERLLPIVEAAGAMGAVLAVLILQALLLQMQGRSDQALALLEHALLLAEPEGYVRVFIGKGTPMGNLLRQAVARSIAVGFASRLLAELGANVTGDPVTQFKAAAHEALVEPLSQRELEVLHLLAAGLPNKGIAKTLVIAVSTVKKHLKNIYQKLNVHSRTEAIARARELGILNNL
ncbi:LuxR C-terminal-related transcriptional regulator [Candidatus Leptofilum sp.]|uniref:LuxR C-terminal-related transcriptional regulator n=1 Tax=Candidatus Leptofilum sp. TaxID=3241576 RepID=UPI003B592AC0